MMMLNVATAPPKTVIAKRVVTTGKDGSKRLFLVKMSGGKAASLSLPRKAAQGRLRLPAQLIRGIKRAAEQPKQDTSAVASTPATTTMLTAGKPATYTYTAPAGGGSSGGAGDAPIKREASLLTNEPDAVTPEGDAAPEETPPATEGGAAGAGEEQEEGILAMLWPKDAPIYKRPGLWLVGLAILGGAHFYTNEEID